MARPRKEGMDYFPHDSYAVNDKKIEALRMLYGNDGYAFYFILLETIYQEPNFELDVSDAETIQILSKKVSVTDQKFNSMLETALKRDCFCRESYYERHVLTSNGIKKRANVVIEKRVKMQESHANKGKKVSDPVSDAEIPEETPQSKSKVKGKESINKDTIVEIINYLNKVTGKSFSPDTKESIKLVSGRLSEGRTVEQFRHVIDVKTAEWLNDEKMSAWLKPNTLFAQSNFESYLNQKLPSGKPPINPKEPRGLKLTDAYDGHYQEPVIEPYDYNAGMSDEERELNLFAYKKSG